ncbi:oxygen-dependent protoporphyrinogen oxidase [Cryptotrichosporon argae]
MRIAILGAGLTGLASARRLATHLPSARVTILESASRAGGWVHSHRCNVRFTDGDGETREGEVVLESGPRTIRPRGGEGAMRMLRLIDDLGLRDAVLAVPKSHPAAKNRFILNAVDASVHKFPFLRFPALRRIPLDVLREPFRRPRARAGTRAGRDGNGDGGAVTADDDESVLSFLSRRLPAAVPLISAFTHGIYAASPAALSIRACFPALYEAERDYGSIVLGMLRAKRKDERWGALGELGREREAWSIYGLKGGTDRLTETLVEDVRRRGVEVGVGSGATGLRKTDQGVEVDTPAGPLRVDHVVAALPPPTLSGLIPLPQLTANATTSVGVVNVVYACPPDQVHPPGFGYLVPRAPASDNPEGVLGVIFDSTALPGAEGALAGSITRLTVMMGGPYWTTYPSTSGSPLPVPALDELPALALRHLHRSFPRLGQMEPLVVLPHLNTDCIPTYAPGHGARMRELHTALVRDWDGRLSVAGSGYGGVSVNDCVGSGEMVAEALLRGEPPTGLERWANWK